MCTAVLATSVLQQLKKKENKTQPFMVVREGMQDPEFPQGCSLPCPGLSSMQCWDFPSHISHLLAGAFCITMPQVLHSRYQEGGWWESFLHCQTHCLSLIEKCKLVWWPKSAQGPLGLGSKTSCETTTCPRARHTCFIYWSVKCRSALFPSAQRE